MGRGDASRVAIFKFCILVPMSFHIPVCIVSPSSFNFDFRGSNILDLRRVRDDLRRWGLVQPYKAKEAIITTKAGWKYLAAAHPEVVQRRRPRAR